jgi:hypothetical protein
VLLHPGRQLFAAGPAHLAGEHHQRRVEDHTHGGHAHATRRASSPSTGSPSSPPALAAVRASVALAALNPGAGQRADRLGLTVRWKPGTTRRVRPLFSSGRAAPGTGR